MIKAGGAWSPLLMSKPTKQPDAPAPAPAHRSRQHKLTLDCYDWGPPWHRVTVTIDEDRLAGVIGRAISRHDHRTELAGGAIVITAEPLPTSATAREEE